MSTPSNETNVEHVTASHCKQVSDLVLEGVSRNGVDLGEIKRLLNPKMEKLDEMHIWFSAGKKVGGLVIAAILSGGGLYGIYKAVAHFFLKT